MLKKVLVVLSMLLMMTSVGCAFLDDEEDTAAPGGDSKVVGTMAPDIQVYTLDGKPVKLSSLRGKPVFLNFWATWCPPCVGEMPHFQEMYPQYKDKMHFMAVSVDEKGSAVPKFVKEKGFTFPIYWDKDNVAAKPYDIQGIPASYIIDAQGKIVAHVVGGMSAGDLEKFLKKAK